MKMPTRTLVLVAIAWACALGSGAQYASSPGEPLVEGVPPDEPVMQVVENSASGRERL